MRFAGRVVLVTGAAMGIGREIAIQFAAEGATVVAADRNAAALRDAVEAIQSQGGVAQAVTVDVTRVDDVEAMVAALVGAHDRLDILVNNAGITAQRHFLDTDLETWHQVLAVNLTGTFVCARAAARAMAAGRGGRIVNVSSHSGLLGSSGRAAYAASKGGVNAMTRAMAVDLAESGITVNAVAPGPVETPLSAAHSAARREAWAAAVPLGRYGTAAEIAAVVLFLASDDAAYMTGQVISVDGGFSAAGLRTKIPRDS